MAEPIIVQPATVEDFSGGQTDNFIAGDSPTFERADNLAINDNAKLESRPGSILSDPANPQIPAGQNRVGDLFVLDDQLFQQSVEDLYFNDSGFTTLQGPSGNPAFKGATNANFSTHAFWNKHMFVSSDVYSSVKRVYKDETNTFRMHNSGLPRITEASAIELANDIRAQYEAHRIDVSQHTAGADTTNSIFASPATDFDTLALLTTELLEKYEAHEDDAELAAGHVFHAGQENADHSLVTTVAPTTLDEIVSRLEDLKAKLNSHDADSGAHAVVSSHQVTKVIDPVITPTVNNSFSYVYAFVLKSEYMIGSVTFIERGPVRLVSTGATADDPSVNQIDISKIPELVNGVIESYDTSNIKVEVYRTQNNGTVLYKVGEVDNGTATFADTSSDSDIINNITLYTEGDVLDNDPPPKAKYMISINDIIWYGGIKEGTVERPNRVRHSNKNAPFSNPESHFEDLDDEIVGMGAVNVFPIIFCENKIFRLEGFYDTTGRGFIKKREVSNTVGCVSHRSIVQVRDLLFFASDDGFYFTDGFQVKRISENINETYKGIVETDAQRSRIYGTYDESENRVLWACQADQATDDNDTIFVCYLRFGVSSKTPFNRWTDGGFTGNFSPSSIIFKDNQLIRADKRGYLFTHSVDDLNDPKVVTSETPSEWQVRPIVYDYRSVATDFGQPDVRKWVTKMIVTADNVSNISMAISSMNDNSGTFRSLKEIRYRDNIEWGDQVIEWGPNSDSVRWDFFPIIEEKRRFPAGGLRCSYKQIRLTNADTIIMASDVIGLASTDDVAKTLTLESAPTFTWEQDAVDYFIAFESDNYTQKFLITARTDSVLTLSDPNDNLVSGVNLKWQMTGIKKSERLELFSYSILFAPLSRTQDTFRGATGENG